MRCMDRIVGCKVLITCGCLITAVTMTQNLDIDRCYLVRILLCVQLQVISVWINSTIWEFICITFVKSSFELGFLLYHNIFYHWDTLIYWLRELLDCTYYLTTVRWHLFYNFGNVDCITFKLKEILQYFLRTLDIDYLDIITSSLCTSSYLKLVNYLVDQLSRFKIFAVKNWAHFFL